MKKIRLSSRKSKIELELNSDLAKSFKEFAKEFDNNLSIAFKILWDNYWEYQVMKYGLIDLGSIDARLSILEEQLKTKTNKIEKPIKTLGGRTINKININKKNEEVIE